MTPHQGEIHEAVAADIGGTHARFALARIRGHEVVALDRPTIFKTAAYRSLAAAWRAFADRMGRPLPRAAGIAIAGAVHSEDIKLTNSDWIIRPSRLLEELGLERLELVNDFAAVGHAVPQLGSEHFLPLCGPDGRFPPKGQLSIVGPGTGLGVASVLIGDGAPRIFASEGGHTDFAPIDPVEDAILARLRERFGRVSVERLVSGPGLGNLRLALASIDSMSVEPMSDAHLWAAALAGEDPLAAAALDRFCKILGSVAGDIALVHGASAVLIGGGIGLRLAERLPASGFAQRFAAKGRFERLMNDIPVKILTHPHPGLIGAAAAFAANYGEAQ